MLSFPSLPDLVYNYVKKNCFLIKQAKLTCNLLTPFTSGVICCYLNGSLDLLSRYDQQKL